MMPGKTKKKSKNMKPGTDPLAGIKKRQKSQSQAKAAEQRTRAGVDAASFQSFAQKRAENALEKIKAIAGKNHSWESNYLAYVKALPATIIMSGLGQAMAMEKAGANKKGDVRGGHKKLYDHMNDWLCGKYPRKNNEPAPTDILTAIINGSEAHYLSAQAEAMEYLEWLKKFAVAYLVEKKDDGGEDG